MTVVSVSYPFARVGADAVGGAEQVLSTIDEALVREGHRSIVIAQEGSRCAGELEAIPSPQGPIGIAERAVAHRYVREAIARVLGRQRVDVVHLHGFDFHAYAPDSGPPVVVTLHLPLDWYPREVLCRAASRMHLHCVSAAQRALRPEIGPLLDDIPNGVPLDRLRPCRGPKAAFVLALGRICPEKGVADAVRAAREAHIRLVIAGRVFPYHEHQRYFELEVAPLLDGQRRFVGAVGARRKWRLLALARCLLVPAARRRPARWWRWRRSPAARRWSRTRQEPCLPSWSMGVPASSWATLPRWPERFAVRPSCGGTTAGAQPSSASRLRSWCGAISPCTGGSRPAVPLRQRACFTICQS